MSEAVLDINGAPPAAILLAVASELAALGRTGSMLQELVAGKVRTGALTGMALLDAQDADLLVQSLAELSNFLRAYAEGLQASAPDALLNALDGVKLSALSGRLLPERAQTASHGPGGLDLF